MAIYIGYSSTNLFQRRTTQSVGTGYGTGNVVSAYRQPKKYTLTDEQLVIQDIVNALSIPQGSLPGNPSYGTTVWGYVFEPGIPESMANVEDEIRRVINQDSRIILNTISTVFQENGLMIQMELSIAPFNTATQATFFLNKNNGQVSQV